MTDDEARMVELAEQISRQIAIDDSDGTEYLIVVRRDGLLATVGNVSAPDATSLCMQLALSGFPMISSVE